MSHPTPESSEQSLKVHEWLSIVIFIGGLSLLGITAYFSRPSLDHSTEHPHYIASPIIEIFVKGAVENPGIYRLKAGACVKDVLSLAQPTAAADLRRIKLESKLRNGRVLNIPPKKKQKKRKSKG